jgi:RimJ/RimL family protein N-acetyltransferase
MNVLETPRLRLRWFRERDADFLLGLLNEPAWIAGIRDSGVRTREDAVAWMNTRLIPPYWQVGHGFWLVERRADAEPLGMCGIFKRDTLPLPDLGYGFAQRHWGQGYAREAARACLDYAVQALGRRTLLAITAPVNPGSTTLLQDLGFVETGLSEGPDGPSRNWRWDAPAVASLSDEAAQAELVQRFWRLFRVEAGTICTLAALPALCLPEARFEPPGAAPLGLCEFLASRIDLLESGRLADCAVEAGPLEAGQQRCRWSGHLDGQAEAGESLARFEFARDVEGRWRIASLAWT